MFERLTNLLKLIDSEVAAQQAVLDDKTATLKAGVLTAVKRSLDIGDYSAVAALPEYQELSAYELAAKRLREVKLTALDLAGSLENQDTGLRLAAAPVAAPAPIAAKQKRQGSRGRGEGSGNKTDRLMQALKAHLSTEEFRLVDWTVLAPQAGLDSAFCGAVATALAKRGQLLMVKQGYRSAYALPA